MYTTPLPALIALCAWVDERRLRLSLLRFFGAVGGGQDAAEVPIGLPAAPAAADESPTPVEEPPKSAPAVPAAAAAAGPPSAPAGGK